MAAVGYVFMCLVFGTTYLAIKIGLNEGIPPFYMAGLRFAIASLLIVMYLVIRRTPFPKTLKEYAEIAFLGCLMTTIPFAALFWSQQYINSGMASLLVAIAPVFIAILTKADKGQWLGVCASVAGVYLIAAPELQSDRVSWHTVMAYSSIVGAELFFAYGAVRSKRILASGISAQMFNGLQMGFASLLLLLVAVLFENPLDVAWSAPLTESLLYLAVIASVFASGVYYWLVKTTNALFPSTWTYVAPIIAMLVGYIYLDETMAVSGTLGAVLVIGGVLIVNRKIFVTLWQSTARRTATPGNLPK